MNKKIQLVLTKEDIEKLLIEKGYCPKIPLLLTIEAVDINEISVKSIQGIVVKWIENPEK